MVNSYKVLTNLFTKYPDKSNPIETSRRQVQSRADLLYLRTSLCKGAVDQLPDLESIEAKLRCHHFCNSMNIRVSQLRYSFAFVGQ